jgi:hypothetical protein
LHSSPRLSLPSLQLLAALDRDTFSRFDDKDVKNGNATPTVLSVAIKPVGGSSNTASGDMDTRKLLLNSCFSKALVDTFAPPIDAKSKSGSKAAPQGAVPWYDVVIDFTDFASHAAQDQSLTERVLAAEHRKFHTVPPRQEA